MCFTYDSEVYMTLHEEYLVTVIKPFNFPQFLFSDPFKKKIPVRSNPEIVPVLGKQFPKHGLKWHKKDQNCHACKA